MARNLSFYSECADPGDAYSYTTSGNIAVTIIIGLVVGGIGGGAFAVVMAIIAQGATLGCVLGIGFYALAIYGLIDFKHWYYNKRLMCIKHDECAIGTIVSEPTDAVDGDRKMNILVAPFIAAEVEQLIIQLMDQMRAELPALPDVVDLQNRQIRVGYILGMDAAKRVELYIRLTEEKMFVTVENSYQKRYYRRNEAIMGTPAFDNSDDDTLAATNPNPMFRHNEGSGKLIVPYMHCEIEGNRLARWLDNVLVGVIAGAAAFTTLCVLCEVVTLGAADFLCGLLGGLASLLVAFFAWLISHFVNDPDDGVAGEVDIDVEDTDFDTPASVTRQGDVVIMYGDWIMDTEHEQYFEIHPVKAYYLLCQGNQVAGDWELTEEMPAADCEFSPDRITGDDLERMCKIIQAVENTDPDDKFTTPITHAATIMP